MNGRSFARGLFFVDEAGPRVVQSVFAALFCLGLIPAFAGEMWSPSVLVASAVVPWLLLLVPWQSLPPHAIVVMPLVDFVVITASRIAADGRTGTGLLVVLPALWLARKYSYRGAVWAGVAVFVLMTIPWLVAFGVQGPTSSLAWLAPVAAGASGLVLDSNQDRLSAEVATSEERRRELEQQRRINAAVLESVDIGLALYDAQGELVSSNARNNEFIALAFPDGHAGVAGQTGLVSTWMHGRR